MFFVRILERISLWSILSTGTNWSFLLCALCEIPCVLCGKQRMNRKVRKRYARDAKVQFHAVFSITPFNEVDWDEHAMNEARLQWLQQFDDTKSHSRGAIADDWRALSGVVSGIGRVDGGLDSGAVGGCGVDGKEWNETTGANTGAFMTRLSSRAIHLFYTIGCAFDS